NSIPELIKTLGFFRRLNTSIDSNFSPEKPLVELKYQPDKMAEKISVTISENERKEFLENLSKSNLSINQLKKKYSVERPTVSFGKPNAYAKLANRFFRNFSNELLEKGYLKSLNDNLRKMSSPFVVGTYVAMSIFTIMISFFISIFLLVILLFYNIGLTFPFLTLVESSFFVRFIKVFWIIFAIPIATGLLMYFYPKSESKSLGEKINQELPFVAIHMSAIATSGVEPISIFKIILNGREYPNTKIEFKKLINFINFQGNDFVSALKKVANSSPSQKLRELLDGLATTITSGGDLHQFLDQHAGSLLLDYKLERQRYTKTSETFMDIYISIVIAAPMILLMLFVIMGSTGQYFLGLTTPIMSLLIIFSIIALNIGFLIFLRMKQPNF
ncbi:MAG: type II secretion system F family protein, partial [Nanoarchaeota archaeon]